MIVIEIRNPETERDNSARGIQREPNIFDRKLDNRQESLIRS